MKDISEALQQEIKKIDTSPDEKADRSLIKKIGLEIIKEKTAELKEKLKSKGLAKRFHSKKPGFLYQFKYSPLEKDEKQKYDRYPIVLVLQFTGRQILGVNLHLLPPMQRAIMLFMIMKNMQKTPEGYAKIRINTLLSNRMILKYIMATKQVFNIGGVKSSVLPISTENIIRDSFEKTKFVGIAESKVHQIIKKRIRQQK